ncbi:MAG: 50S ribosomal protein L17 [Patescibacteria group bacterium]
MRHRKRLKKMGLARPHRMSLLKNLVASLVLHGSIRTTENRAKALASRFGRLMSLIQKKDAREAIRLMPNYCGIEAASRKLVGELKTKYEKRKSGFTRITSIGVRKGDNSNLVQIELI